MQVPTVVVSSCPVKASLRQPDVPIERRATCWVQRNIHDEIRCGQDDVGNFNKNVTLETLYNINMATRWIHMNVYDLNLVKNLWWCSKKICTLFLCPPIGNVDACEIVESRFCCQGSNRRDPSQRAFHGGFVPWKCGDVVIVVFVVHHVQLTEEVCAEGRNR